MNKKIALIFGITGQDGSYLAEFLLEGMLIELFMNLIFIRQILKKICFFSLTKYILESTIN